MINHNKCSDIVVDSGQSDNKVISTSSLNVLGRSFFDQIKITDLIRACMTACLERINFSLTLINQLILRNLTQLMQLSLVMKSVAQ